MARGNGTNWWKVGGWCLFALVLVIISIVLIATSLKKLKSSEVGLEYDTQERDIGSIKGEGLHNGPPFFEFVKYPAVFVSKELQTTCVSKDGLSLDVTVSFQFLPNRTELEEISTKFRNYGKYQEIISIAARSAIHHGCGDFNVAEFQSRRVEVQEKQKEYMEGIFADGLHASVIDVQLRNVSPPGEWESAVEDKEDAREDIQLARNERTQQITKANTELKVAEEEALRIEANAERNVKVITTRAEADAEALQNRLETEANQTKLAMETLGLDTKGTLRYILNRQIETKGKVEVSMKQPAVTPNDEL